jgi:hypothetical protein
VSKKKINEEVLNWYAKCDNKGISSKTMANTAVNGTETGSGSWRASYPSDNSDFERCVLFQEMCPTAFRVARKILKVKPVWDEYFKNWQKMKTLLLLQKQNKNDGMKLYNLMHHIQEKSRLKSSKT